MAQDKVDITSLLRELRRNTGATYKKEIPAVDKYAYTETRNSLSSSDVSKLLSLLGGTA